MQYTHGKHSIHVFQFRHYSDFGNFLILIWLKTLCFGANFHCCIWPNIVMSPRNVETNVIEIEGLLFPGFGPMYRLHGKLVFPVFPIK